MALILLTLVALCLAIFGWLWLCAGLNRSGWRGVLGKAAVQLSALCLLYGLLIGRPLSGLYLAMFPPLAWVELQDKAGFGPLVVQLTWAAAPYAALVGVAALVWKPLRAWAPGLAAAAAMVAGLALGEQVSERAMCDAGSALGITGFHRLDFAATLAQDAEAPVMAHALAEQGGRRLGWSYRQMGWVELPADSPLMRPPFAVTCPPGG